MKKLKRKMAKLAEDFEKVTANELVQYSNVINRIQIKNRIGFVLFLPPNFSK